MKNSNVSLYTLDSFYKEYGIECDNFAFVLAGCHYVGDYIVSVCYVLVTIKLSQMYCRKRASDRKLILSQLEEYLNRFDDESDMKDSEKIVYDRTKMDYENFMEEKTRGAMMRSKSQYYNEGE